MRVGGGCTAVRASRWLEAPGHGLKVPPFFPQRARPDLLLANSVPAGVEQEASMPGRVANGRGDFLSGNLETGRSRDREDPSSIPRLQ